MCALCPPSNPTSAPALTFRVFPLSLFYTSHSCTKHIKFLICPPLSLSCSPSFSSSLTPSLSWWVWLIGDTWDECETWELSRSSEHQPPCRVSIPYCTVKMKSREKKKRYKDRNEKKGGAVRVWFTDTAEGWGLCVFSPRPARGISFKTDTDQWIRPFYVRQTLCWRTELLKQTSRYRSL